MVALKAAYFDTNTNLFDGGSDFGESVILVLECSVDRKIEPVDYPFDEARLYYSVGQSKNWQVVNGGKEIVATKGGQMGNSKYQQLIKRTLDDLQVPLAERQMSPREADVWVGLSFVFEQELKEIPEKLRQERDIQATHSRITLPTQWMQSAMPAAPSP
jgi:hypothetical protein